MIKLTFLKWEIIKIVVIAVPDQNEADFNILAISWPSSQIYNQVHITFNGVWLLVIYRPF